MTQRTAYAWEQDGKFFLSIISVKAKKLKTRPAAQFDNKPALQQEAAKRNLKVEWENG